MGAAMNEAGVARAEATIDAPASKVWEALTTPALVKRYMFGATVTSDWRPGSPITWKGEWKGKEFEDKGVILELAPGRRLRYTHYSPLSGLPDRPENYHTVTIDLSEQGQRTRVSLSQDNNPSEDAREHSEKNWQGMLEGLKRVAED
jgi:uncharacterized protein YndB with AHSA1/START domain